MINHYSDNIQNVILREIFKANHTIQIAVAWFTNDLLFQPLILKLMTGVKVEIILNKDDINISPNNKVDFDTFVIKGGVLYWNTTNRLLHHKFCIIDDNIVISGSYNWTNKAESNYESISVFINEPETSESHKNLFRKLSNEFGPAKVISKDISIAKFNNKCPLTIKPYLGLKFYNSVRLFRSRNTPILANQYNGGFYALLDNRTFTPLTQYIFSEFSYFLPKQNLLWSKGETKWGLFDCHELKYTLKPQFDNIEAGQSKKYTYYILTKNDKYGVYILDHYNKNNNKFYDCLYDSIQYSEPYGCPILDLQYNNNHKVYVFDSKCELGGPNCKKVTFEQPYSYSIIVLHYIDTRYDLYVIDDKMELKNKYDSFINDEKFIFTFKQNKKGVYIINHKKEFECKYDNITFSKPFGEGVLCFQRTRFPNYSFTQMLKSDNNTTYHGRGYIDDISIDELATSKTINTLGWAFDNVIIAFPESKEQIRLCRVQRFSGIDTLILVSIDGKGHWVRIGDFIGCDYHGSPIHSIAESLKKCKNDAECILALVGKIIRAKEDDEIIRFKYEDYKTKEIKNGFTCNLKYEDPYCYDVYVLDSRTLLGGEDYFEVRFETSKKPKTHQSLIKDIESPHMVRSLTDYSSHRKQVDYTAIILRNSDNRYEVYISSSKRRIPNDYAHISCYDNLVFMDDYVYHIGKDKFGKLKDVL